MYIQDQSLSKTPDMSENTSMPYTKGLHELYMLGEGEGEGGPGVVSTRYIFTSTYMCLYCIK